MNNQKWIDNLMVIHRDLAHLIEKETLVNFDKTISTAIICLATHKNIEEIGEESNEVS